MRAAWASFAILVVGTVGCGAPYSPSSGSGCAPTFVLTVTPATGTADHKAAAPGNQVTFTASGSPTSPGNHGCPLNDLISVVSWTTSDTVNVQLAPNTQNSSVVATCLGSTTGAVTIGASQYNGGPTGSGSATLTCQ